MSTPASHESTSYGAYDVNIQELENDKIHHDGTMSPSNGDKIIDVEKSHDTYNGVTNKEYAIPHNHIDIIERELNVDLEQQEKWDSELREFESELQKLTASKRSLFGASKVPTESDAKWFTYILVAFASMGGLLSGLDQSLISGANLYMPADLNLNTDQRSWVNSLMPLGAFGGALILSPLNELFGRKYSIMMACIFFTIGAALQAGAQDFAMLAAGRVVMGVGLGVEGGTVPVYVSECVSAIIVVT